MSKTAAEVVLQLIGTSSAERRAKEIVVEPELILRESTCKANQHCPVLSALP
jgi:DNA-binding LacI/PurR family transcriptional regulator